MSAVKRLDLTSYGCPLHYIKAREALKELAAGSEIIMDVNNGKAIEELLASLRQDGHDCEIEQTKSLTTLVKVTKKHD